MYLITHNPQPDAGDTLAKQQKALRTRRIYDAFMGRCRSIKPDLKLSTILSTLFNLCSLFINSSPLLQLFYISHAGSGRYLPDEFAPSG